MYGSNFDRVWCQKEQNPHRRFAFILFVKADSGAVHRKVALMVGRGSIIPYTWYTRLRAARSPLPDGRWQEMIMSLGFLAMMQTSRPDANLPGFPETTNDEWNSKVDPEE